MGNDNMQGKEPPQNRQPPFGGMDENRIDINLIAMLLWQSLLCGTAVGISHMNWYLPDAGPGEMGLQYGLICFGFLCLAMVMFHVGGIRDSLAMRAEFSQENRYDKWQRSQHRLQERRQRKDQQFNQYGNGKAQQQQQMYMPQQTFGLPNEDQPFGQNNEKEEPDNAV